VTAAASLGAFLRAPGGRRALALEAAGELARARLVTLLPARVYTSEFGVMGGADAAPPGGEPAPGDAERAAEIGRMVENVARAMPFRALCLQQAIAVRRMLRRRGVPATVMLGVSRNAADRAEPRKGAAAHAWVAVGGRVINGDADLDRYTVVARFG
jgi:hypothetical protein